MDGAVTADIKKLLHESPPTLFRPTLTKCLNVLADVYIEWLDSKEVSSQQMAQPPPHPRR